MKPTIILSWPKLDHYRIRGKTNTWIQNFLSDRSQAVVVDGEKSSYIDVDSGVPQGSVLGPSLFLFYINDMPCGLKSTVRLFADDTIAYLAVTSEADAVDLQSDLTKFGIWEKIWNFIQISVTYWPSAKKLTPSSSNINYMARL